MSAETLRSALRHAVALRGAAAGRILPRLSDAPLRAGIREARARLEGLAARLKSVSYENVLARGYVLVSDAAGHPITTATAVKPGADLRLRFSDGEIRAIAAGGKAPSRQGSLAL